MRIPKAILVISIVSVILASAAFFPVTALEQYVTTAELIQNSPYTAHVRVEESTGSNGVRDYRLIVLETFRGQLPEEIQVRVLQASRVVDPDGTKDPYGSEWIVILGEKNSLGFYPLRSLAWAKIELLWDSDKEEMILARPITGFPPASRSGGIYSLSEFRRLLAVQP